MPNSEKKQPKYSKKSSFTRDKHYAYSEEDIERIDSKQNEWNEKRKDERTHNLKIASGKPDEEVVTGKPDEEVVTGKPEKQKNDDYAIEYEESEEEEEPTYSPTMKLVMHGIPFEPVKNSIRTADLYSSWSVTDNNLNPSTFGADLNLHRFKSPMDNIMRTFQYYGDVKSLHTISNIDSTYTVTAIPNEWNKNIADVQREIENKGFAMIAGYKVTKDDTTIRCDL
jgi:hypothetical protein